MAEPAHNLPYTLSDWIELEKTATVRHEFEDGVFRAMSGGTDNHNAIAINFSDGLREAAQRQRCRRRIADMKTIANGQGYYPDFMLSCAPLGTEPLVEYNPCLIVEVLSPSTQHHDKGKKLNNYLLIPSLEQYVLVHTDQVWVEVYRRQQGYWQFQQFSGLTDVLEIVCAGETLSLEQIYEGTTLTSTPD